MSAIEYFYEYPLRWSELETLSEDEKAFLAVAKYAVTEINALSRLYIFAAHELTDQEPIDYGILTQRFVVLRSWSAKLFEFSEFIKKTKVSKSSSVKSIQTLASKAFHEFQPLKSADGYSIARNVRNESTNHYSFVAAKKNLRYVSKEANCGLYLHKMVGNSIFPMGEEVMFAGRLTRHGTTLGSKEEVAKQLDVWMGWNLDATRWVRDVQLLAVTKFIKEKFPGRAARKKDYWIPNTLVGSELEIKVPIFLRTAPA